MGTVYGIKDAAARSGFTVAALRYYEEIGLLPRSARTPAGYRQYDDRALERLAFIAHAKHLGCTLHEIADLATAWEGDRCAPVQDRLRATVAAKIGDAQQQIAHLTTLTDDLRRVAEGLQLHRPDGACDGACGCVSDPGSVQTLVATRTAERATSIACTLSAESLRSRLADWEALLGFVEQRAPVPGGLRLSMRAETPLSELVHLVAAEQDCCRFLSFSITFDARGVAVEVYAPDDARSILDSLFASER